MSVCQDRLNDPDLQCIVVDTGSHMLPHQRGAEADGQVPGVHAVVGGVFLDAVEMLEFFKSAHGRGLMEHPVGGPSLGLIVGVCRERERKEGQVLTKVRARKVA